MLATGAGDFTGSEQSRLRDGKRDFCSREFLPCSGITCETWGQTGRSHTLFVKVIPAQKSSSCRSSLAILAGRPPFRGANARLVASSNSRTNSSVPRGRPVCVAGLTAMISGNTCERVLVPPQRGAASKKRRRRDINCITSDGSRSPWERPVCPQVSQVSRVGHPPFLVTEPCSHSSLRLTWGMPLLPNIPLNYSACIFTPLRR
jgi:hypothetical protein